MRKPHRKSHALSLDAFAAAKTSTYDKRGRKDRERALNSKKARPVRMQRCHPHPQRCSACISAQRCRVAAACVAAVLFVLTWRVTWHR